MPNSTPPSGIDVAMLGIGVSVGDSNVQLDALQANLAATADSAIAANQKIQTSSVTSVKSLAELGQSSKKTSVDFEEFSKRSAEAVKEQTRLENQMMATLRAGDSLLAKLNDLVKTYGLSTEELYRLAAAELGVASAAEPLIANLEALKLASFQYNIQQKRDIELYNEQSAAIANQVAIQQKRDVELHELRQKETLEYVSFWERQIAIQEKAALEQIAIQQNRDTELNAMREKQLAQEKEAALRQVEIQQKRDSEINSMRQKERAEYASFWERELAAQEAASAKQIALAERQAIEEIKWNGLSVKQRIAQLEELKLYQANAAITPSTISHTFSSAAISAGADPSNLTRLQNELNAAQAVGHGNSTRLADATNSLGNAFNNSRVRTEALVLAHEAYMGQTRRLTGSLMVMAEYITSTGTKLIGTTGFLIGAAVATGALIYEMVSGAIEVNKFEKSLILTGNASGMTRDKLHEMGTSLADGVTGPIGKTISILEALVASGKFGAESINQIAQAALNYSHLTGKSAEESAKLFESMSSGVAKWSITQNEHFHQLSLAQYIHIDLLERQGLKQEAMTEAAKAFTSSTDDHGRKVGVLVTWYREWGVAVDRVTHALKEIGAGPSLGQQLTMAVNNASKLQDVLENMKKGLGPDGFTSISIIGPNDVKRAEEAFNKADALRKKLQKDSADESFSTNRKAEDVELQAQGLNAKVQLDALTQLIRSKEEKRLDAIANADNQAALVNAAGLSTQLQAMGLSYKALTEMAIQADKNKTSIENVGSKIRVNAREQEFQAQVAIAEKYNLKLEIDAQKRIGIEQAAIVKYKDPVGPKEASGRIGLSPIENEIIHQKEWLAGSSARMAAIKAEAETDVKGIQSVNEARALAEVQAGKFSQAKKGWSVQQQSDAIVELLNLAVKKDAMKLEEDLLIEETRSYKELMSSISKSGEKQLSSINATIVKQKEHNAEIGKTKEQIQALKETQNSNSEKQMQNEADAIEQLLKENDLNKKARDIYVLTLANLNALIAAKKELAATQSVGIIQDATQSITELDNSILESNLQKVKGIETEKVTIYAEAAKKRIEFLQSVADVEIANARASKGGATDEDEAKYAAFVEKVKKTTSDLSSKLKVDFKIAGLSDASTELGGMAKSASSLGDTFKQANSALSGLSSALKKLSDVEKRDSAERRANGENAKLDMAGRIGAYGDMADASANFFDKESGAYKALHGIAEAFHAAQMAMQLVEMAQSAIAAVLRAGADGGWVGMIAMAAAVAALGFAVSSGGGGDSSQSAAEMQKVQGAGSVLGNDKAKSESIAKSLEMLLKVDDITLIYTQQMTRSLQNIEASISGLANLIFRLAPGALTGNVGGFKNSKTYNFTDMINTVLGGPLKGLGEKISGFFFGSVSKTLIDSGYLAQGTFGQLTKGQGIRGYGTIQTEEKAGLFNPFGGNSVSTEKIYEEISTKEKKQFALIFSGIGETLRAAGEALGLDGKSITDALSSLIIDLPLSIKDLKGADLEAAINNWLSGIGDRAAASILPGMEDFVHVGEAYFQTVIRVATGFEQAQSAMEQLGIEAVSYTDILYKQGDVFAETARQSILKVETTPAYREGDMMNPAVTTGIGKIIQTFTGSGADLVTLYKTLIDTRATMLSFGLAGADVSAEMLKGAGSLEKFTQGSKSYFSNFYTESEKLSSSGKILNDEFLKSTNVALPANRAAYRTMVEGIDRSTAAGQRLYGQMMANAEAANTFYSSLESLSSSFKESMSKIRGTQPEDTANGSYTKALANLRSLEPHVTSVTDLLTMSTADFEQYSIKGQEAITDTLKTFVDAMAAAGVSTSSIMGVVQKGLLGEMSNADVGKQLGQILVNGVRNAISSGFAEKITGIFMNGIVNPIMIEAMRAGATASSISGVISKISIADMVHSAQLAINALTTIFNDPEFKAAMEKLTHAFEGINFGGGPASTPTGTGTEDVSADTGKAYADAYKTLASETKNFVDQLAHMGETSFAASLRKINEDAVKKLADLNAMDSSGVLDKMKADAIAKAKAEFDAFIASEKDAYGAAHPGEIVGIQNLPGYAAAYEAYNKAIAAAAGLTIDNTIAIEAWKKAQIDLLNAQKLATDVTTFRAGMEKLRGKQPEDTAQGQYNTAFGKLHDVAPWITDLNQLLTMSAEDFSHLTNEQRESVNATLAAAAALKEYNQQMSSATQSYLEAVAKYNGASDQELAKMKLTDAFKTLHDAVPTITSWQDALHLTTDQLAHMTPEQIAWAKAVVDAAEALRGATASIAASIKTIDIGDVLDAAEQAFANLVAGISESAKTLAKGDFAKELGINITYFQKQLATIWKNIGENQSGMPNDAQWHEIDLIQKKIAQMTGDLARYTELEAKYAGHGQALLELEKWDKEQQNLLRGNTAALAALEEAYQLKRQAIIDGTAVTTTTTINDAAKVVVDRMKDIVSMMNNLSQFKDSVAEASEQLRMAAPNFDNVADSVAKLGVAWANLKAANPTDILTNPQVNNDPTLVKEGVSIQDRIVLAGKLKDAIMANYNAELNALKKNQDERMKALTDRQAKEKEALDKNLSNVQAISTAFQQLADYAKSMLLGTLSILSPTQKMAESLQQYEATLAAARSNDPAVAAAAASKLQAIAEEALKSNQAVNASSPAYADFFKRVLADMQSFGGMSPDKKTEAEEAQKAVDVATKKWQDQIADLQKVFDAETLLLQTKTIEELKKLSDIADQWQQELNHQLQEEAMAISKLGLTATEIATLLTGVDVRIGAAVADAIFAHDKVTTIVGPRLSPDPLLPKDRSDPVFIDPNPVTNQNTQSASSVVNNNAMLGAQTLTNSSLKELAELFKQVLERIEETDKNNVNGTRQVRQDMVIVASRLEKAISK